MSNIILPPDSGRAEAYKRAMVIPMKFLRSDGSITAPDKSGVEVLPPSPERAALWERLAASPARYLYPDGSIYDDEGGGTGGGVQGPQGEQGIQGEQGPPGIQGVQGIQGEAGTAGAIVGSFDTVDELTTTIPTGTRGDLYYISPDLYAWDDRSNVWFSLGRIAGPQGIQGEPGQQGAQGEQGLTGIQGPQGLQGLQGAQGLQGLPGTQGPQGLQGLQGLQGEKGDRGDMGPQGPSGVVALEDGGEAVAFRSDEFSLRWGKDVSITIPANSAVRTNLIAQLDLINDLAFAENIDPSLFTKTATNRMLFPGFDGAIRYFVDVRLTGTIASVGPGSVSAFFVEMTRPAESTPIARTVDSPNTGSLDSKGFLFKTYTRTLNDPFIRSDSGVVWNLYNPSASAITITHIDLSIDGTRLN